MSEEKVQLRTEFLDWKLHYTGELAGKNISSKSSIIWKLFLVVSNCQFFFKSFEFCTQTVQKLSNPEILPKRTLKTLHSVFGRFEVKILDLKSESLTTTKRELSIATRSQITDQRFLLNNSQYRFLPKE